MLRAATATMMVGVTAVTTKMAPNTEMLQVMKDCTEYDTDVSTDSVSFVNLHNTSPWSNIANSM